MRRLNFRSSSTMRPIMLSGDGNFQYRVFNQYYSKIDLQFEFCMSASTLFWL